MIRLLFREELFELAIKVSNVVKGWSSLDKIKLLSFSEHCHFFSHAQPMLCCKFQQTHWHFSTRHDFVQPSQLFVSFPVKTPCCQLRRQVGPFIAMFTLHHHVCHIPNPGCYRPEANIHLCLRSLDLLVTY